jgi:hypothetical protein
MVTREGTRTLAEVSYTENVEVFPRYFYPVRFLVQRRGLRGGRRSGPTRPE